jgi:hypothetical protein
MIKRARVYTTFENLQMRFIYLSFIYEILYILNPFL